ncbi:MAG: 16S rRNA (guanine(966)-N(2))-methyltransferase RsmD [Actinobacteria bacterium]|nr:16S rRNA (guanine(966)-N(2))-methyltransferase RsmD [Actinomycetota bacterium]
MRVIAGELGGRMLIAPPGTGTRPTSDRVKEALFSIVGPVDGDRVLDLFAGSGALAIEALSRGAVAATCVDDDRAAAEAIAANASVLGLGDRLRLVRRGWRGALREAAEAGELFDLVLADPPYELLPVIVEELGQALAAVLAPGAVVVIEHARGAIMVPGGIRGIAVEREDTRRYRDTEITVIWTPGEGT